MKTLKRLILSVLFLVVTGCASVGPKIVIETPEPAEDFVVLCQWYQKTIFSGGHGGGSKVDQDVYVTESGKEVDCGTRLTGGDGLVLIYHPIYSGSGSEDNYTKDGVQHIVMNKTKLDLLDEQKAKFEAGYWDKNRNPGARYAESLGGCGFSHQYFDYYSQVKKVDKEHFKNLYSDFFLKCKQRVLPIKNKYLQHTYQGKRPSPEKSIENLWNSKGWEKYQ